MIEIIAEAGIAHCGRLDDAIRLVDAAHDAGADIVKFQIYHTELMVREVPNKTRLKLYELTTSEHRLLKEYCDGIGIGWLASCFDIAAVEVALALDAKRVKLGSGEIVNHGLIRYIAESGLDLLLSTGASTIDEVFKAAEVFNTWSTAERSYKRLALLHCVSNYPSALEHCNLRAITTLKHNFHCPVGWSDHTTGFDSAVAAVGVGADIIEKHIMLSPGCPDEAVSLTPENFRGYVATIRRAEAMMGDGEKELRPNEAAMRDAMRYRWHPGPVKEELVD